MGSCWFLGFSCIFSIFVAVAGVWVVRRKISHQALVGHHDVAGALLSIVGTLYAVVLGLVVVASLNKFDQARTIVEHEASSLRKIHLLASGLPPSVCLSLRNRCVDYASTVAGEEWNLMQDGKHSVTADHILVDLSRMIVKLHPGDNGESNIQAALLNDLGDLTDARASRTVLSSFAFDPIVWSVLLLGGGVVVVFTYFFGVQSFKVQVLMTALVATVLVLNMLVVAMFYYPFSGDIRVEPNAFLFSLNNFKQEHYNQPDRKVETVPLQK